MEAQKDDRKELLRQIKDQVVNFKESPLYGERIRNKVFPVIGEGDHYAAIMAIGEAPGAMEAKTGRPFAGAAGKVLDELLLSAGIQRADVYITNLVKDRPPSNRDPLPEEVAFYSPFLDRQIEIIQPKVIVLLGRHSMKYIMEKFGLLSEMGSISKIHGGVFEATASYGKMKVIPMYHPAAALYNPELKSEMRNDFETLKNL